MDGEGWASQLETNAQNGELESGVGWGVREQASVKCTTHRLPHKNLPNNNKQKQERRGRKKCIITVLRFFDSARTSNGTKQKMRQNGTTGGEKKLQKVVTNTNTASLFFSSRYLQGQRNPSQGAPPAICMDELWRFQALLASPTQVKDMGGEKKKDEGVTLSMYRGQ